MSADEARALADSALIEGPLLASRTDGSGSPISAARISTGRSPTSSRSRRRTATSSSIGSTPTPTSRSRSTRPARIRGASRPPKPSLAIMRRSPGSISRCRSKAGRRARRASGQRTIIASGTANSAGRRRLFRRAAAGRHPGQGRPRRAARRSKKPQGKAAGARRPARSRQSSHAGEGGVRRCCVRCCFASAAALIATPPPRQTLPTAPPISGLGVRNIGSATMSGRISAVAGRQEKDGKVTLLIGSASGGVWKSEDGGTTFKPVFDKQPVQVDRRGRARSRPTTM